MLKGIYLSKALTCIKVSCINKNCFFTQGDGYLIIHTSHIDHFTPQHTAFEQSAACLSVFLELLPVLIPFAIL